MSLALVGVLGVVLGGLLAGVIQFLLAQHDIDTTAKVAARLVTDALMRLDIAVGGIGDHVDAARAHEVTPMLTPLYENLSSVWRDQRAPLARVLGFNDWETVASVCRSLDQILGRELVGLPDSRRMTCTLVDEANTALTPVAVSHGQIRITRRRRKKPSMGPKKAPKLGESPVTEDDL